MNNLTNLSNSVLIESYNEAINLSLNKNFIKMLEEEMKRRNLPNNTASLND